MSHTCARPPRPRTEAQDPGGVSNKDPTGPVGCTCLLHRFFFFPFLTYFGLCSLFPGISELFLTAPTTVLKNLSHPGSWLSPKNPTRNPHPYQQSLICHKHLRATTISLRCFLTKCSGIREAEERGGDKRHDDREGAHPPEERQEMGLGLLENTT